MNIYGCIPASFLPPHSALTYWAQAASLAGIVSSDPNLVASNNLALELKKSQLPRSLCDALHKSTSESTLRPVSRANEGVPSALRVSTSRLSSLSSVSSAADALISIEDQERLQLQIHMQMQHLRRHHQQQHHHHQIQQQQQYRQEDRNHRHHHQPFSSSSPPPVGNGLAPLQALCESDVSAFRSKSSPGDASLGAHNTSATDEVHGHGQGDGDGLKFGINRILSEDFGKTKTEKENSFQLSSVPEECRSLPLCPCSSAQCTAYAPRPLSPVPYPRASLPSLSAVHALQPPCYPLSSSVDALPGPYSILSSDPSSGSHQPKRKRSWSRAVFSNLQRKGLEKRFEVQKYVTKPDRRQLAAMLGLTDAQVKVWFQNRRMKWRHAQQHQGNNDGPDTDTTKSTSIIPDRDEQSAKYHVHNGNDSSTEKGLDLRRLDSKGENYFSGHEANLSKAGKSLGEGTSEDSQSSQKVGSEIQPPRPTASDSVSPIIDCSQPVPTDESSGNNYEHKNFTSTPKITRGRFQNIAGVFSSEQEMFKIQYPDGKMNSTSHSHCGAVSAQTPLTPDSFNVQGQGEPQDPIELNVSSAMPGASLLIQTHGSAGYSPSPDKTVEPVSSGDSTEYGIPADCDDAVSIVHIDVDN